MSGGRDDLKVSDKIASNPFVKRDKAMAGRVTN